MTKFADDLYDDLLDQHGAVLADLQPPVTPRRHPVARRAVLAAGTGGLAVAATAGSLVALSGSPAYALTTNHDGSVNLAVYQEAGIAQASAKFRQLNDRVAVVPVRAGCPSISSLPKPAVSLKGRYLAVATGLSAKGEVTVNASNVPAGDLLVIAVSRTGHWMATAAVLTSGQAPSCVSLPTAPAGGGSGHSSGSTSGPSTSSSAG